MATELAKAYVQIIPSAKGIEGSISSLLDGEATSAGKSAGEKAGAGLCSAIKKGIAAIGIGKLLADGISGASEFETAMANAVKGTDLDIKGLMALLDKKIDEPLNDLLGSEARDADGNLVHERQRVRMTWGQAMQIYASLRQTATYGENVALHGRQGHAEAIRKAAHPALLKLVDGLMRIYNERRGELSDTVRQVTGLPVYNPDPLYMPVKMLSGAREGLDVKTYAWSPLARSLTPRVRNRLDFDLSANLLDIYGSRTQDAVGAISFGVRGIALRSMLARKSVWDAMRKAAG